MPTAFRNRGTLINQKPGAEINKKESIKGYQDLKQKALNIKDRRNRNLKKYVKLIMRG
jgi:hypothetical protein